MVCPRCIAAVEMIMKDLKIPYFEVRLGEVLLKKDLSRSQREEFKSKLVKQGFELLDSKNAALINQIKTSIIQKIQSEDLENLNLSEFLPKKLNMDYSQLSKLFSSTVGVTIEHFTIEQKIEKVKELLIYDELSLKEIGYRLGYSSSAHLSAQFKKTTGLTPTQFKELGGAGRKEIDKI